MNKKWMIAVVGPTAVGKTSVAIELAQWLSTEIMSCDSRQFYKEMRIGTAVPTAKELASVPHHFIQQRSIHSPYTVGDFEREVEAFLPVFFERKNTIVMAGGSGLFEKAVTHGLDQFPEVPEDIRTQLRDLYAQEGLLPLQNELHEKDPLFFAKCDRENPQRVLRALEIIRHTQRPFSSFQKQKPKKRDFDLIKIGLERPREELYDRINRRVDLMIEEGLVEEAQKLHAFSDLNALQTVGYKELFRHFNGEWSLAKAIEEIKKNSRRYAKRQLTWYRKDEVIRWFSPDDLTKIKKHLQEKMQVL